MAKKRTVRVMLPLPMEPIMSVPGLASFPGSVYNAVLTLAIVYWQGGCRPLPAESSELCSLVRYAPPRWQRAQPRVIAALETMLPQLSAIYAVRQAAYARQIDGARRGALVSYSRRQRPQSSPIPPPFGDTRTATTPHTPVKTERYKGDGRTDLNARAAAIAAKAKTSDHGRLSDTKPSPK